MSGMNTLKLLELILSEGFLTDPNMVGVEKLQRVCTSRCTSSNRTDAPVLQDVKARAHDLMSAPHRGV